MFMINFFVCRLKNKFINNYFISLYIMIDETMNIINDFKPAIFHLLDGSLDQNWGDTYKNGYEYIKRITNLPIVNDVSFINISDDLQYLDVESNIYNLNS